MHKVMQTKFGVYNGNCFQACIASVLNLELHEAPDFMNELPVSDSVPTWPVHLQNAMIKRGYCFTTVMFNGTDADDIELISNVCKDTSGYFIACGMNTAETSYHVNVWNQDGFVYDPTGDSDDKIGEYVVAYIIHTIDAQLASDVRQRQFKIDMETK